MEKDEKLVMALLLIFSFLMGIISGYEIHTVRNEISRSDWCNQKIKDSKCICVGSNLELSGGKGLSNITLSDTV